MNSLVGLTTLLGIIIHEIPHEMGDFAILLRSGFDRRQATKAQLVTGLGGILGAALALYYSNSVHSASLSLFSPLFSLLVSFRYIVGVAIHQRWFPLRRSGQNSSGSFERKRVEVSLISPHIRRFDTFSLSLLLSLQEFVSTIHWCVGRIVDHLFRRSLHWLSRQVDKANDSLFLSFSFPVKIRNQKSEIVTSRLRCCSLVLLSLLRP